MSVFYCIKLPGFPDRPMITRDERLDQEAPGPWDIYLQKHIDIGDPLDPNKFEDGTRLTFEDWERNMDCTFMASDGAWVECDRQPW